MSHLARARQVFDLELTALRAVRKQLDTSFDDAVDLMVETLRRRGKVVVVGIGKSGHIGAEIAATLTSTVNRGSDLVARYGGEEFVFLAPMTDREGILAMARRVVEAIQALQLPHADSPEKIVTVSLGIAALVPQPGQTVESLLQQADEALYRAKSLGRNRAEA